MADQTISETPRGRKQRINVIPYGPKDQTPEERFWKRVVLGNGDECWKWAGLIDRKGYGRYCNRVFGTHLAHRISYLLLVGPIPDGKELDHVCRNRGCVNPAHLEPVTHHVNLLRGNGIVSANKLKTHCPQGHPYEGENLICRRGTRECRICYKKHAAENQRRRQQKKRAMRNAESGCDILGK